MAELPNIPKYRVIRAVGRGGMSQVFLAIQESLGREVALKVMKTSTDEPERLERRFLHEARTLARLMHRNIVQVIDISKADGVPYMAMEYLQGGSLGEKMRKGMSLAESLSLVAQIAAALDFAHEHGVIHRDIKPDNIMYRDDYTPVLADFGIARDQLRHTQATQSGMMVGTANYMSPEQIQGHVVDGRSDLYSLGIVFHELLTSSKPFFGNSIEDILLGHLSAKPPRLRPELAELQPLLDRMLAKRAVERYATCRELIKALKALLQSSDNLRQRLFSEPEQSTTEHLRAMGFQRPGSTVDRVAFPAQLAPRAGVRDASLVGERARLPEVAARNLDALIDQHELEAAKVLAEHALQSFPEDEAVVELAEHIHTEWTLEQRRLGRMRQSEQTREQFRREPARHLQKALEVIDQEWAGEQGSTTIHELRGLIERWFEQLGDSGSAVELEALKAQVGADPGIILEDPGLSDAYERCLKRSRTLSLVQQRDRQYAEAGELFGRFLAQPDPGPELVRDALVAFEGLWSLGADPRLSSWWRQTANQWLRVLGLASQLPSVELKLQLATRILAIWPEDGEVAVLRPTLLSVRANLLAQAQQLQRAQLDEQNRVQAGLEQAALDSALLNTTTLHAWVAVMQRIGRSHTERIEPRKGVGRSLLRAWERYVSLADSLESCAETLLELRRWLPHTIGDALFLAFEQVVDAQHTRIWQKQRLAALEAEVRAVHAALARGAPIASTDPDSVLVALDRFIGDGGNLSALNDVLDSIEEAVIQQLFSLGKQGRSAEAQEIRQLATRAFGRELGLRSPDLPREEVGTVTILPLKGRPETLGPARVKVPIKIPPAKLPQVFGPSAYDLSVAQGARAKRWFALAVVCGVLGVSAYLLWY